jgi:hypothetical protein
MNPESPVDPSEFVLRRIPANSNCYDPSLAVAIVAFAFRPTDEDVDGISLYRELFASAHDVASSGRKPASFYVVARMKAADVLVLGLTLVPTPWIGNVAGHVSIPEINTRDYNDKAKKPRIAEFNRNLAILASKDVITRF